MKWYSEIMLPLLLLPVCIPWTKSCHRRISNTEIELCKERYVRTTSAITDLGNSLQKIYFGQHIAEQVILRALTSHLTDRNPTKPLVLSFHGSSGVGKSYMYRTIINSLFKNGLSSEFVQIYLGPRDFREWNKLREYQSRIEEDLNRIIRSCERSLIIFEEVDMMPPKLLDVLVPYLDGEGDTKGFNQTKAIYILTSNQNAEAVDDITLETFEKKLRREDLTSRSFHDALRNDLFNAKKGGFKKARIIEKNLIDYYIPFLPLERRHVIQCIKAEMSKLSYTVDPEKIADEITYWPKNSKIYSSVGCRPVERLVKEYGSQENPFQETQHGEL